MMNETITIEQGSGNIFADLSYPNAEEALTKARLAQCITEILERIIQASLLPLASQLRGVSTKLAGVCFLSSTMAPVPELA
jgi:hypothetical protein